MRIYLLGDSLHPLCKRMFSWMWRSPLRFVLRLFGCSPWEIVVAEFTNNAPSLHSEIRQRLRERVTNKKDE